MAYDLVGAILALLPIVVVVFVLRWVRFIYQNSEKQVEQNEKIIELLMEIKGQKSLNIAASFERKLYKADTLFCSAFCYI